MIAETGIEDVYRENPVAKYAEKNKFIKRINYIKRQKEENGIVTFQIISIKKTGFLVKTRGLYALVSFSFMPWHYKMLNLWKIIFPSLVRKSFKGYIHSFQEGMPIPLIKIKADTSQFQFVEFPFEKNETYTAIVLHKNRNNLKLYIDLGYAFGWKYGSLPCKVICSPEDENIESSYNPGDEFQAVYVGKSLVGNNIFRYNGNRYFSKEHNLIGQKVWATFKRTNSSDFYFKIYGQYYGKLVFNEDEELGISHELLQKTLRTLPNGQSIWCQIVDATSNGILQLKWLIDASPPIEYVLSVYNNAAVLNVDSPDFQKIDAEWLNKKVWCKVIQSSYPDMLTIENEREGVLSIDAIDYKDMPLSSILNAFSEIPGDQQIFCKIKGIYPDGKLKLQWIVNWDERAKKMVFPNRCPQKIDLRKFENIKEIRKRMIQMLIDNEKRRQHELNEKYIGKTVSAAVYKQFNYITEFLIDNKFFGEIAVNKQNYPFIPRKTIRKTLSEFKDGDVLLCEIQQIDFDDRFVLRWDIENDPAAEELLLKLNKRKIKKDAKNKSAISEKQESDNIEIIPSVGETLWLMTQRNKKNELYFPITNKYKGKINPDKQNYPDDNLRKLVKRTLRKTPECQFLLCRVQKIHSNFRVELRWEVEEDPDAEMLLAKLNRTVNKTKKRITISQDWIDRMVKKI